MRRTALAAAAILLASAFAVPPADAQGIEETTGAAVRRLWRAKAAALAPAAAAIVVDGDLADWADIPQWAQGKEPDEGIVSPVGTLALAPTPECLKVVFRVRETTPSVGRDGIVILVDFQGGSGFDLRLFVRTDGVLWDRNTGRWGQAPPSVVKVARGPGGVYELSMDWSLWLWPMAREATLPAIWCGIEHRGWVRVAIDGNAAGRPRWASWASPPLVPEPTDPTRRTPGCFPVEPTEGALQGLVPRRHRVLDGEDDPRPGPGEDPLPEEHEFVRAKVAEVVVAAPGANAPPGHDAPGMRVLVSFDGEGLFVVVHGLDPSRRMPILQFSWDRGLDGWHSACWNLNEDGEVTVDLAPPGVVDVPHLPRPEETAAATFYDRVPAARGSIFEARVPYGLLAKTGFFAEGGAATPGFLHLGTNRVQMLTRRTAEFQRLALLAPGLPAKGKPSWRAAPACEMAPPVRGTWSVAQGPLSPLTHASSVAWDLVRVDSRGESTPKAAGKEPAVSYGFGAPLFAPAAGVVLKARDSARDAPTALSNELRLGLPDGAFVRMVHLRQGSLAGLAKGRAVAAGDRVAAVGSSGTKGPHLQLEAWRGDAPCPVVLLGVEVGLNAGADDPWRVAVPRWEPEEGLFFRYEGPGAAGAGEDE